MAWVIPYAVMLVIAGGSYWYASSLDYPDYDSMLKANDSTVSAADTSIGFAPFGQYPSSELPVPVIYGKARLNGLIIHVRPYGDNFSKCHYLVMWGDKGYTVDEIYVDKYKLRELPNYYENTESAVQGSDNSWANSYPLGGEVQIALNNTGSFGVMLTTNEPCTLVASTPLIFYGGGTVRCRSLHTWPKQTSTQTWQWKLINLNDVSDIKISPVFVKKFEEVQEVDGGDKVDDEDVDLPGAKLQAYTFDVPDTLSKWSVSLIVTGITHPADGAQIALYNYSVIDVSYNELVKYNGTVSHVHLVKDESLTSSQPVINGIIYKADNGNPATSLYEYLTDTAVGLGLKNVDFISASDTAAWCEANDYYYNRAITAFYPDDKVIKEMCTCGRIILYEENGNVKMRPDKEEIVTYLVDDTEIMIGTLKIGINTKASPNRVEGQYTEPFYGYTIERIYAEDYEDILLTGVRAITLGLAGVTEQAQAHDLAHLALNYTTKSKYWCSFTTGMETAAMFKVGDVIQITSDTNVLIDGKKWRVQKIDERGLFTYSIYCKQYVDEIYVFPVFAPWYEEITDLEPIHGWPGVEEGAATVINIVFYDISFPNDCSLTTDIQLRWVNPTERFDDALLYYSYNNIDWYYIGATSASKFFFTWPMRYSQIYVKVVSRWNTQTNELTAPIISQYITGDSACEGTDYSGYGRGGFGGQPYGV